MLVVQRAVVYRVLSDKSRRVSLFGYTDSGLSDELKEMKAEREKNKGNEAFRAGDFEEALVYYSRSLSLLNTVAAHNNRAQTCMYHV